MKLQKREAYEYKGEPVHKFLVTLPAELVNEQGWEGGEELEAVSRKEGILLRLAKEKA